MTKEEAYNVLVETISKDLRHPDYPRVTALADEYNMYITGNGIDKVLQRFNPREDEVMFDQRKRLTIPITPAVADSLMKPFAKVPRTPPITRKITAKKETDSAAVSEIEDRIQKFYGSENNIGGLDYYLQNVFADLVFHDPNSWIIIEFDAFDPAEEKATPRPFEVSSKEAIRFSIRNNEVKWLVIMLDSTYQEKFDGKIVDKPGKKYTIYAENDAWQFEQVSENEATRELSRDGKIIDIDKDGSNGKKESFITQHFATKTKHVPAFRVGYIQDAETKRRTYINPFHKALCHFKKAIKQGSEYDLSTCLHVFPQKIVRLTQTCPGENGESCDQGRLPDGKPCGACKGTGKPIHTSGQDVIEVEIPDSKDDLIALTDFVYYVPLPIELLKLQKEWVDDLEVKCHQTVFNSSVLLRKNNSNVSDSNIEVTATEKDADMENLDDTLTPFAEKLSGVWQTIVKFIAILTDNDEKVSIIHRFPSNFRKRTRRDLYLERKTLKESGAPGFAVIAVDDELAEEIFADDANGLLRYRVKKEHFPFIGKNDDEVAQLLASTDVLKSTKILYNYFDAIFFELEKEYNKNRLDFYIEKYEVRKQKIDEKVEAILEELKNQNQTAFEFKMSAIPPEGIPDNTNSDNPGDGNTGDDNNPTNDKPVNKEETAAA